LPKRLVSFVLPVFNESDSLHAFHAELSRVADSVADRYDIEFCYVDDGSRDNSLAVMHGLAVADPRIVVLKLSRNYGHQMAITAGLDHVKGDAVIVMDTDGQDPPSLCLKLLERWEDGAHVVYAQRASRQDTPLKRATAHAYYRILARLADIEIPRDTGDFRLMDRTVVTELNKHREHNRFMRGLVASLGFRQDAVRFNRLAREAGETNYPLRRMIRLAVDGVTSFSTKPLTLVFRLGVAVWLISIVGILYALTLRIWFPAFTVSGWTMMIITLLFLGGMQIIVLGIIGLYVGRIYTEVQNRPLYIVERAITGNDETVTDRTSVAVPEAVGHRP
jgi:glycosyltransferase involved in cell wall biosynthesis